MNNLKAFQLVDTNRTATTKQLYLVAGHFAKLQSNSKLYKVFGAILQKFNAEHLDTPITMGDVSKFLEMKKVPVKFTKLIQKQKTQPKTQPKVEKQSKTVTKPKPKPKASTKPKASELSVEEFKKKFEALASQVKKHDTQLIEAEKRMNSLEAKLDIIASQFEAFLTTDADAMDF